MSAIVEQVERATRAYYDAFVACDLTATMGFWADRDDISCIAPLFEPARGRAAIEALYESVFAIISAEVFAYDILHVDLEDPVAVVTCAERSTNVERRPHRRDGLLQRPGPRLRRVAAAAPARLLAGDARGADGARLSPPGREERSRRSRPAPPVRPRPAMRWNGSCQLGVTRRRAAADSALAFKQRLRPSCSRLEVMRRNLGDHPAGDGRRGAHDGSEYRGVHPTSVPAEDPLATPLEHGAGSVTQPGPRGDGPHRRRVHDAGAAAGEPRRGLCQLTAVAHRPGTAPLTHRPR